MVSMRNALKAAFESAGVAAPDEKSRSDDLTVARQDRTSLPKSAGVPALNEAEFIRLQRLGLRRVPQEHGRRRELTNTRLPVRPPTTMPEPSVIMKTVKQIPMPSCSLDFSPNARFRLNALNNRPMVLLPKVEAAGAAEQCTSMKIQDTREVAFGLDFGTSSVVFHAV